MPNVRSTPSSPRSRRRSNRWRRGRDHPQVARARSSRWSAPAASSSRRSSCSASTSAPASRRRSSTSSRRSSSARTAACRRSRATAATPRRSAPRRTRWSSTASPARTRCRTATSSPSTSASRSAASSATRRYTFPVGEISDEAQRLLEVGQAALSAGIEQARPGNHLSDIGHAVQKATEEAGFSVVRSLVGHGVGRKMHEDPQIPNFGEPGRGPVLQPGMTLAIEPMINAGGAGRLPPRRRMVDLDRRRLALGPLRAHRRGDRRGAEDPHEEARTQFATMIAPREASFCVRAFTTLYSSQEPR